MEFQNYPIQLEIAVAWGEMDAYGHVNNVVFFRYFESARIAYLGRISGEDYLKNDDLVPILASTECNYKRPVVFPDTLTVYSRVTRVGNSSFDMEYKLTSREQNALVAEGKGVVVNVDPETGRGRPIPDTVRVRIEQIENSER